MCLFLSKWAILMTLFLCSTMHVNALQATSSQLPGHTAQKSGTSVAMDRFTRVASASLVSFSIFCGHGGAEKNFLSVIFPPSVHAVETRGRDSSLPSRGFQTKSGLKYFELKEGDIDVSPRYGQLVSFHYSGYYRPSPDSKLDLFDSSYMSQDKTPFLHKHGNGRIIRGIDEGLHTMKVGGKRRVIIPKSIGYTELGLGPLPSDSQNRKKLGNYIDFLDKDAGELIFDLELLLVADDENDQGYYEDEPVSQDDVRKLVLKSLQLTDETLQNIEKTTPRGSKPNPESQNNPRGPSKI